VSSIAVWFLRKGKSRTGKPIAEAFLGDMAKYTKKPSLRGVYNEIYIPEGYKKIEIPEGHILLGVRDYESMEPVTLRWNGKSFGLAVIMKRGAGKTQWVKTIALDQIHAIYGHYIIIVDPKNEYFNINKPQDDPIGIDQLAKLGITPQGYDARYAIPTFLSETIETEGRMKKVYTITAADFNVLSYSTRLGLWMRFLGLAPGSPASHALMRVMHGEPRNTKHMLELIEADIAEQTRERGKRGVSMDFLYKFREAVASEVLGAKKEASFDFALELANNKIIALELALDTENQNQPIMQTYAKIGMEAILQDRIAFIRPALRNKYRRGLLDKPIMFVVDEADILASNDARRPTRSTLRAILTKYRQFGMSLVLITQEPTMIDKISVKQCNYIVTCKVDESMYGILKARGIPQYMIDNDLMKLAWDDTAPTKQFCCLTPDTEEPLKIFYPIFPRSKIWKESESEGEAKDEVEEFDEKLHAY